VLAVAGLTAIGALLRFYHLGHQGFWFDEANTALLVHFSPGKMLGLIPQSESTPPLYYLVAWVWARAFGYTEAPLRSLSALCGVLVIPVAYAAGAKLAGRRAGLIAAALTAFNPLLIWYSQEARSYEMLVLLSAGALLAFAYAREDPSPVRLAAWALVAALALCTHYYAALAVVPQAVWVLVAHRRRRPVYLAVGGVAIVALGLSVLAVTQKGNGRTAWIATVALSHRLGQVVPQFASGFPGPAEHVLEPLAVAIVVVSVAVLVFYGVRGSAVARGGLVAGALALAGLVVGLLFVASGTDDLLTRNVLALWMPAAVMVAAGLAAPRSQVAGTLAAVVLCGIGLTNALGVARDRSLERPDWRGVARLLSPRPSAGAPGRAILVQHYRDLLPLSLYLPGLKFVPDRGAAVSELDIVSFTDPPSGGFCWWGSACNLWPSKLQRSYAVPGFHVLWRRHVYQFTVLRMVSPVPRLLTPGEVAAALTRTRLKNDELLAQP
jgi:4-amino-4-deoxy-L-arabinose transferase-like glycosyltransferase